MKTWFTSLNGVIMLPALSLLSFVGYVLMEMRYFLEKWMPGDTTVMYDMKFVLYYDIPWPERLMVIVLLIVGLIAATAMAVYLRSNKKAIEPTLKMKA